MSGWQFTRKSFIFITILIIVDYSITGFFLNGINKYFGLENQPEILINGSSMTLAGFDKTEIERFTNKNIAFYSRPGVSLADRYVMIEHFFNMYPNDVEAVIYEINPLIFSRRFTSENVYTLFYPYMDNLSIDTFIQNRAGQKEYFLHKYIRSLRYDVELIKSSINGYLSNYSNIKTLILDTTSLEGLRGNKNTVAIEFDPGKRIVFERTMELIKNHGAKVFLINMPIYKLKFQTFNSSDYNKLISYFESYSGNSKNVAFINLDSHPITTESKYFSDPLHLNRNGEKALSKKVIELLNN